MICTATLFMVSHDRNALQGHVSAVPRYTLSANACDRSTNAELGMKAMADAFMAALGDNVKAAWTQRRMLQQHEV